jgi:WD domain, G-beta repeat
MKTERVHDIRTPASVLGLAATSDFSRCFASCMDAIYVVEPKTASVRKIGTHESYSSGATWLESKQLLITSGYDGALQWFDMASEKSTRVVQAHKFWSWQIAASPNESLLASVTGQYLAGNYLYEPAAQEESCVKVFDVDSGELRHEFEHIPSVQSVAFSPDSKFLAAGNLMGEIRVWDLAANQLVRKWKTDEFTSWGVIKSHCYIGGIYALAFSPSGSSLLAAGMGPMQDPMAGNGKQRWIEFDWNKEGSPIIKSANDSQIGEGLMETLTFRPDGNSFVMGGRLRGGNWNAGFFDSNSGELLHSLKTGYRITRSQFNKQGNQLMLGGTQGQPSPQRPIEASMPDDGKFGRIEIYTIID